MVIFDNLTLEITRCCDQKCQHCMRGEPENLNITIFKQLTKQIKINTLNITGGEPFLSPLFTRIFEVSLDYNQFCIYTNGLITKVFLYRIKKHINDLYDYANNPENCRIILSQTEYHKEVDVGFFRYLQRFSGFRIQEDCGILVNQGRAKVNGIGQREPEKNKIKIIQKGKNYIIEGNVYFNAKGNFLNCCELSYKEQENPEWLICTHKDFSIEKFMEYERVYCGKEKNCS